MCGMKVWHTVLIVCWLYYKENSNKEMFRVDRGSSYRGCGCYLAYVSKELASLTPEEEFVTMYVYDSHSHVL